MYGAVEAKISVKKWEDVEANLRALSFDPYGKNGWSVLGFIPLEGSEPTCGRIDSKAAMGKTIAEAHEPGQWSEDCVKAMRHLISRMEEARRSCQDDLGRVKKERREIKQSGDVPQWQEPSPELLTYSRKISYKLQENANKSHNFGWGRAGIILS